MELGGTEVDSSSLSVSIQHLLSQQGRGQKVKRNSTLSSFFRVSGNRRGIKAERDEATATTNPTQRLACLHYPHRNACFLLSPS
jgi:hypothetical protein